ncbi:hypothetical protein C6I20_12080 [Aeromicrobium sp. A1-2]|uniref:hypothetical protein n=1 Tax=Aeromicrobium sp. A1-2 TaxID=2107713 RepID=UPI000E4EB24D|nr:hypothetical protein [Aeromicrobium sp. A1-2]AXT85850.1 hypothetical protein C6I20_12080 [Aeromicrobium sp. A1-2]
MYLRDLSESLLRRWYLVAVGLLLTVGLSVAAASLISPTYEAKSSLVLVPPRTTTGDSGNPYLFLGGLQQSVDVLARALSADSALERIAERAPTGHYEVVSDVATSAPILLITAVDSSKAGAQRQLDAVKDEVPLVLQGLQSSLGVKKGSQITTSVVATDDVPKTINKARYRLVVLVALVTIFGALLLVGYLDGVLLARKLRKDPDAFFGVHPGDDDLTALERELQAIRPSSGNS